MPPDPDLLARLDFARSLALEAQALILRHFDSAGVRFERKDDGTPVTIADRDAEQLIRARIERQWPDDGLIGEEHGQRSGRSDYRWVIDPIDGTKSFIHGVPLFGTLIGIQRRAVLRAPSDVPAAPDRGRGDAGGGEGALDGWRCAAGVARFPALDECIWGGPGLGAFHTTRARADPQPCRVSRIATLEESTVSVTSPRSMLDSARQAFYLAINHRCGLSRGWSDCYGSLLVATGRIELMIDVPMQLWDVAALAPIIEAAGGRLTGWDGRPTDGSAGGIASNGLIHDQVLAIIRDTRARIRGA